MRVICFDGGCWSQFIASLAALNTSALTHRRSKETPRSAAERRRFALSPLLSMRKRPVITLLKVVVVVV